MQLTPLRGRKIAAFLKAGIGQMFSRSISGGAAECQTVGPLSAF
jgi:hypothetical protein